MKSFAPLAILMALSSSSFAQCEKLIQFDTTKINRDVSFKYSFLSKIDESNYESSKQEYAASVPGYFDGNYKQFSEKRNSFYQLFKESKSLDLKEQYFQHVLSPTGAKAYADCLSKNSGKAISAWIEASNDSLITVGVRNGRGGSTVVDYEIFGDFTPLNKPKQLAAGGTQNLIFRYDPKKDFMIAINATVSLTNESDTTLVELPRKRKFEMKTERKTLTEVMSCGAGCQGNTAGCAYANGLAFVADSGYYLLPDTKKNTNREVLAPGVRHYDVKWTSNDNEGRVTRVEGTPFNVDGNSPHTQGGEKATWTIEEEKATIVEVTE